MLETLDVWSCICEHWWTILCLPRCLHAKLRNEILHWDVIVLHHGDDWLLQCPTWEHLRIPLIDIVTEMDGFRGKSDREKTAFILSQACSKNNIILNHVSVMWSARFGV